MGCMFVFLIVSVLHTIALHFVIVKSTYNACKVDA